MSVATELERLSSERAMSAYESGVRVGAADERCRMLEWAEKQNDPKATLVITKYLQYVWSKKT